MNEIIKPQGELLLRTIAMPSQTNSNGDIFGGWIMSQMDIAGAIIARETSQSRITTVAVNDMVFISPVKVGSIVCCYGEILKIGNTSMSILIEVWIKSPTKPQRTKVASANFVFVAIDNNGNKQKVLK